MSRTIAFEPDIKTSFEVEGYFDSDDYLERIVVYLWFNGVGYDVTALLAEKEPLLYKRLEKEAVKKAREDNFDHAS